MLRGQVVVVACWVKGLMRPRGPPPHGGASRASNGNKYFLIRWYIVGVTCVHFILPCSPNFYGFENLYFGISERMMMHRQKSDWKVDLRA